MSRIKGIAVAASVVVAGVVAVTLVVTSVTWTLVRLVLTFEIRSITSPAARGFDV